MLHINNQHYAQVCKGDRADVCPRRPTQPVGRLTRPFRPLEDNLDSSGTTNPCPQHSVPYPQSSVNEIYGCGMPPENCEID